VLVGVAQRALNTSQRPPQGARELVDAQRRTGVGDRGEQNMRVGSAVELLGAVVIDRCPIVPATVGQDGVEVGD